MVECFSRNRIKCCFYIVISVYTVLRLYLNVMEESATVNIRQKKLTKKDKYLVNTPGCRIENLDAFSPDITALIYKVDSISCNDKPSLTYISRDGHINSINVNKTAAKEYSIFEIKCCYINVYRNPVEPNPDDNLIFSECTYFKESAIVESDVVKVECFNIFQKIYENVHPLFSKPLKVMPNVDDPNVILIGIDGVSMSNFIRTMPKTHRLLEDTSWINLKGYNKIEDNTFPNLIAVLAGVKFSYHENIFSETCNPYDIKKLERCNFLWNVFKRNNYTTAYAEDTPKISTFNSNKAGFVSVPTDYYFRPYFLTADLLSPTYLCLKSHCTGPEKTGIRMQNLVTEFLNTIRGQSPGFGLFWMNTFSHEDVNCPSSMDEDFEVFFKKLATDRHLDNSIVVFFSDHGFRFGKIRLTPTGWQEERLPFIYIWIPNNFRKSHAREYKNLLENSKKLTTPYDLHMTLQDIIHLSNPSVIPTPAPGCSKCHSLFKRVSQERSCSDAGIPDHYCTCSNYENIDKTSTIAEQVANFFIDELNGIVKSYGSTSKGCAYYSLEKITLVKYLMVQSGVEENYLVGVVTNPEANFEATVKVTFLNNKMNMSLKEVNRLDRYAPTSYCVQNSPVQMFCFCKTLLKRVTDIFCNNRYCFL